MAECRVSKFKLMTKPPADRFGNKFPTERATRLWSCLATASCVAVETLGSVETKDRSRVPDLVPGLSRAFATYQRSLRLLHSAPVHA
jgi:hypothetical protein